MSMLTRAGCEPGLRGERLVTDPAALGTARTKAISGPARVGPPALENVYGLLVTFPC